ncbi:Zinc finger protein [Toxocara canis]|uniref:Zinc finger protein n=1 Tax=Toxocara canis TaxID=6265 RepID=A0A0B2VGW8_TOXCA|nr:Zinc finger protein [Toxocara canis]
MAANSKADGGTGTAEVRKAVNKANPVPTQPSKKDQQHAPVIKKEQAPLVVKKDHASAPKKDQTTVSKNDQTVSSASRNGVQRNSESLSIAKNKRRISGRDHNRRNTTSSSVGSKKFEKGDKPRSSSSNITDKAGGDTGSNSTSNRRNNSSNKRRNTKASSNSMTSEGYEYDDDFELDEPFSDSEEEQKGVKKLTLPIPRGRIRTLSGTVPVVGYSPKWGGPTMCLSCLHFFDLPDQIPSFADHLLTEHHIVVVEMELIVDPKRYVEYWRQRFAKESVDKIFPKVVPEEGSALFGKTDYYFEMSETLPEDYSIRQRLAMRRLEEALSCQQRERDDANFSLQCIFCRYTARGNRSKIIHHLYMIHHLNLGSPDNLVFVQEYIEHLKEKLSRNECIYCEKTFSDRNTLMDHMRKRNHREVNPKNNYYDKFYIINYLELGKRWLDVLAEDFEDTMPTFVDSDEEEEEDSWHEWQEDNLDEEQTRVVCLFCEESNDHAAPLIDHIKEVHHFDIMGIIEKEKLDTYDRMKMLNFIRKQNYNAVCFVCGKSDLGSLQELRKHLADSDHLAKGLPERAIWDTEQNLVPIFGNDHLLWMLESILDESSYVEEEHKSAATKEELKKELQRESEANTVQGVVAEDLPELHDSALADAELYDSLK